MKAIIIGSGIGGLSAAIGLRQAGIDAVVYERAQEFREAGTGLSLWANALKALALLGLSNVIDTATIPQMDGGVRDQAGNMLIRADSGALVRQFGNVVAVAHRGEFTRALLDSLGETHVCFGKALRRFEQTPSGVIAHFTDDSAAEADVLIGADGLRSVVRSQMFGDQLPTYSGYTAWRAVIPFDHSTLATGETWGRGQRFGQIPMSDGRVYWFATQNAPEGERNPAGEKSAVQRAFAGWHAPIPALIDATPPELILRNDIYDRPVLVRWCEGRVALLGDAAHPMTPNLGQGACQALEDSVVLAQVLKDATDIPAALVKYELRRVPRANAIVEQSRIIGRVAQWSNPLAAQMRNFLVKTIVGPRQSQQTVSLLGYKFWEI